LTVDDMAAAVGKNISQLRKNALGDYELSAWIDGLVPALQRAGVRVREVRGLTRIDEVVKLAGRETGPVVFAIRTTVGSVTAGSRVAGPTTEILHSVIAMRSPTGAVRFADYGGKFVGSLRELVSQWGVPTSPIELYQSGLSAAVIEGAVLTGNWLAMLQVSKGAVLVMEGLVAIETVQNGVEMAVPVSVVASSAPALDDPAPPEVIKGAFEAYKMRAKGSPVTRLPKSVTAAGAKVAPRPDWLTGVQYRLNALGFGAGPVDGIMGPRTRKAVQAFQRTYPPLAVDGVPGPKTQAMLVQVCGY
jgi:hypothetical protein